MLLFPSLERGVRYPIRFAPWTIAKRNDLTAPRKRALTTKGIVHWDMAAEPGACADHLEVSGFYASAILSYGKDKKGRLRLMRHLIIPTLRKQPNQTESSFSCNFDRSPVQIETQGKKLVEYPKQAAIRGTLCLTSSTQCGLQVSRELMPGVNTPALIEIVTITNQSTKDISLLLKIKPDSFVLPKKSCVGEEIRAFSGCTATDIFTENSNHVPAEVHLKRGDQVQYYCVYSASQRKEAVSFSVKEEVQERRRFIEEMFTSFRLETPVPALNAQFSHCILRGSESIFQTKNGLMHGPGGGNYYAALWTNDQCEYANPFFPYSGYQAGIEQAVNCYQLYEKYMDRSNIPMKEKQPLVTSIIAEGDGYWNGAKDRGDGEMYAYGLARFLLGMGDKKLMEQFYEALVWCMDFALSRKTDDGIIASDADELENRFPSGDANLFTSCITYDALENCAIIAELLDHTQQAILWRTEKEALAQAIERFFGREIEGYQTYRYYEGNRHLRAWICMPLTVELFNRAEDTVRALYSPLLYQNGMLKTVSTNHTTWDRSLLFALRGTLLCGKAQKGTEALLNYCKNRLLGTHAPYPFEAYPEGNRAHLAAESILFARVITEGLLGLRPTGLHKLRIQPRLTGEIPYANLRGLRLFGRCFDLLADQQGITILLDGENYYTHQKEATFDFINRQYE